MVLLEVGTAHEGTVRVSILLKQICKRRLINEALGYSFWCCLYYYNYLRNEVLL